MLKDYKFNLDAVKVQRPVIAPYRDQVEALTKAVNNSKVDIATVHKFQGREKDVIILSTVDNKPTEFSDDPYLLNVAISRAKKRLILVAPEEAQGMDSNIGDLIQFDSTGITLNSPLGTASGDLTGNYPNPTIKDNIITTEKLQDSCITANKILDENGIIDTIERDAERL